MVRFVGVRNCIFKRGESVEIFQFFPFFNRVLFAGHVNGIRDVRGCTIYFLQQWRRAAWVDRARGLTILCIFWLKSVHSSSGDYEVVVLMDVLRQMPIYYLVRPLTAIMCGEDLLHLWFVCLRHG